MEGRLETAKGIRPVCTLMGQAYLEPLLEHWMRRILDNLDPDLPPEGLGLEKLLTGQVWLSQWASLTAFRRWEASQGTPFPAIPDFKQALRISSS